MPKLHLLVTSHLDTTLFIVSEIFYVVVDV